MTSTKSAAFLSKKKWMQWSRLLSFPFSIFILTKLVIILPPRGVESDKRKRQYEHIKESELKRGASEEDAERIAAATVNKTRREKGETKT